MPRRNARSVWACILALHAMAGHAGCLHATSQLCSNGGVCPEGSQCTDTGAAQVCIRLTCGNGVIDPGEVCDDGNNQSGDGCPADCTEHCGDGVLDPGELCDDGNRIDGDGCSADCSALDGIALVSPPAVAFTAGEGDAPPAGVTVSLRLAYRGSVQLAGTPPSWLAVAPATEPPDHYTAAFQLQAIDTSVTGRLSTSVRFEIHHDDSTAVDPYDLPVTYHVEPSDLALQATATDLDFAATSEGPLPAPQAVDVTFNGAVVAVVSAPSWITASAPDPATSPAAFSVAVNTTDLTGGRTLEGDVVLATTRGNVRRTATIHVRYQLAASFTDVRFVAPYVGVAGRGGTIHVRGAGFRSAGTLVTVGVGDVIVGPVVPDSDTQITVSYPPLAEGRYPVTINGSPLAPARPELVIVAPSPAAFQAIDAPGPWARIVYDAERQTIYGANKSAQQIERVAYAGGAWSRLSPVAVPRLTDLALTPDGRSLIVLDDAAIRAISLTDGTLTPVTLAALPPGDPVCGLIFRQIAAANDGKMVAVTDFDHCIGDSFPYLFDLQDHSLVSLASDGLQFGTVAGSADGSRIYLGGQDSSILIFESLSNTVSPVAFDRTVSSFTVSSDASRVIVFGGVFSRSLSLLGVLPLTFNQALPSQDSTRAFLYNSDSAGDHVDVYDLTGPLTSSGQYPLLQTVMLPVSANSPGELGVTMATSPDDGVVFVSGDSELLVVPVR